MARKSKSKAELEAENKFLRKSSRNQIIISLGRPFIFMAAAVFIMRYLSDMVKVLAGKETFADIGISFLANINITFVLSLTFGVGGILYALKERKLRKDTVERLQSHIQNLERMIDPRRSTSYLTVRGNTRPEDMV